MLAAAGSFAAELTADAWRADLAFLARELPQRHKNLFHRLPRAEFERKVKELDAAIPRMAEFEIRAGIVELVAAAGNSHTSARLQSDRTFDLAFLEFPEGLFIIGAPKDHAEAIGARVVSIDGVAAAEVRKRLARFIPAENEFSAIAYVSLMQNVAALRAAGIMRRPDSAEFLLEKDGRTSALAVPARLSRDARVEPAPLSYKLPRYREPREVNYSWESLAEGKTLYIRYDFCQESAALSFQRFAEEIAAQAARQAPEKLVVDLRRNGGGNSGVWRPLLQAMRTNPALRPRGGIYALTGSGTFSSGLLAAIQLREEFQAMIAGEPTCERPNHYGDMRAFRLPNSGISVSYSTKHFFPLDDDPPSLMPELRVAVRAAEFFAGRDPVLEAVLALPASIEANFRDVIARDPGNLRAYAALARIYETQGRAAEAEKLLKGGIAANQGTVALHLALAGQYERMKRYRDARGALNAALENEPRSPQVFYKLGQAALAEGKYADAEGAFRQCFRLEPYNLRGLRGVVDVYTKQKKAAEALKVLIEEADRDSNDADTRTYAGDFATWLRKFDIAAAQYEKAILHPRGRESFETWLKLSDSHRRRGDAGAAVRAFLAGCETVSELVRAVQIGPRMIMAPMLRVYEQALRREPGDAVLMNNLAFLLANGAETDMKRALALAEQARQALPAVGEVGYNLGCIYLKAGRTAQAAALFKELTQDARLTPDTRQRIEAQLLKLAK